MSLGVSASLNVVPMRLLPWELPPELGQSRPIKAVRGRGTVFTRAAIYTPMPTLYTRYEMRPREESVLLKATPHSDGRVRARTSILNTRNHSKQNKTKTKEKPKAIFQSTR